MAQIDKSKKLYSALTACIRAMGKMFQTRAAFTAEHHKQTANIASLIVEELSLDQNQVAGIYYTSLIHDIGEISVPADIINRAAPLTIDERALVQGHPKEGYEILKDIDFPWPISTIILQHHERLDGSGYPYGLQNSEILLESKIVSVSEVLQAMLSHRPYRPAHSQENVVEELTTNSGKLYDEQVVNACLRIMPEYIGNG